MFPLHHPDLNVNNIFVDDNCNITCIIDWAFCSSVPLPVLFMTPGLPQSRDQLETPLISAFEGELSRVILLNHRGGPMEAFLHKLRMVQASRFTSLLCRLASFDSTGDFYLFHDIWQMSDQNDLDFLTFFRSKQASDHYLQLHEEMKQEDHPSDLEQETSYFKRDMVGLTVSRKLTLVSEWTCRYQKQDPKGLRRNGNTFVADDKLWKWVLESESGWSCVMPGYCFSRIYSALMFSVCPVASSFDLGVLLVFDDLNVSRRTYNMKLGAGCLIINCTGTPLAL